MIVLYGVGFALRLGGEFWQVATDCSTLRGGIDLASSCGRDCVVRIVYGPVLAAYVTGSSRHARRWWLMMMATLNRCRWGQE